MPANARNLLILAALLFGLVTPAVAAPAETKETRPMSEQATPIVLHPAAEPRPALKYQLLPPIWEQRPGNAAVWWNRLPAERMGFLQEFNKEGGTYERLSKWMEIPLTDPKANEFRKKELTSTDLSFIRDQPIYSDMDRAGRFESCDWELPFREGNIISMLIPDAQQLRLWARMLQAKAHLEIADGKYDKANRTLQTGYALARHAAQGPLIINALVGAATADVMSQEVQQWVQLPDAPNLYWALSVLPRPLVDFRLAGQVESNVLYMQFPELRDVDKKDLSPEQWRTLLNKVATVVFSFRNVFEAEKTQILVTLMAAGGYTRAKVYLIERGYAADKVEAMPVAQVILLASLRSYDELSDEQLKWFFLPPAEAGYAFDRAQRAFHEALAQRGEILPLASVLLPAISAVKRAETNLQWLIARLRVIEALRLYAGTHHGQWPDHLSDITDVPVPVNPFDGKPFIYKRDGDTARLTSTQGPVGMPWGYEITFAK